MPSIEQLFGAHFRGPTKTKTSSSASQFAGRTTISSGSATATVSTTSIKSAAVVLLGLEGNANLGVVAGTASVGSGSATATVSNVNIAADSIVQLTMRTDGTAQTSGAAIPMEIKSLAAQWITFGWADGQAQAFDRTVHYTVWPADGPPGQVEVKTISDSNYFTVGRADGVAVARDTVVSWLILGDA